MCVCVHVRERQQREYLCDGEGMRVSVFADSPRLSLSTFAVASLNPNASSISTGLVCVFTRPHALGLHTQNIRFQLSDTSLTQKSDTTSGSRLKTHIEEHHLTTLYPRQSRTQPAERLRSAVDFALHVPRFDDDIEPQSSP